jgi:hypothetical protein
MADNAELEERLRRLEKRVDDLSSRLAATDYKAGEFGRHLEEQGRVAGIGLVIWFAFMGAIGLLFLFTKR